MELGSIHIKRSDAESFARYARKDFKKRNVTKYKIVVKPIGPATLKRRLSFKEYKFQPKRQYGIFIIKA